MDPQRREQILRAVRRYAGYPAAALFFAAITFYVSIDRDRVKEHLIERLGSDPASGAPLALGVETQIDHVSVSVFSGLGVTAYEMVVRRPPPKEGDKPIRHFIDELKVKVGLFGLILRRPTYRFKAKLLGGEIAGTVAVGSTDTEVSIEAKDLTLTGALNIQQTVGLPLEGKVDAKIELVLVRHKLGESNGTIELTLGAAAAGDGKAKLVVAGDPFLSAGLTVPKLRLGNVVIKGVVEKGKLRFEPVRAHSVDLDLAIDGYLDLRDPISFSQPHLYLRVKPSDAFLKKEETLGLVINGAAGAAKRIDGYLGFAMAGSFTVPSFQPNKEPPIGVTISDRTAPPTLPSAPTTPPPAATPPPATPPPAVQPSNIPPVDAPPKPADPPKPEPPKPEVAAPPPAPAPAPPAPPAPAPAPEKHEDQPTIEVGN